MINNVQKDKKTILLRREGYSYTDIANELKVSKASVSNWLKNLKLTEAEKAHLQKNIKTKIERGKLKASITIRSRKIFKDKTAYENAEREFKNFIKEPLFLLGLGLYWNHGSSTKGNCFQFMSSDPSALKIILGWVEKYLKISRKKAKYRLFIDINHKNNNSLEYWSRNLSVSGDLFQKTVYLRAKKAKRDREYNGSVAIIITKIDIFRKVVAWQKLAMRYYS